MNWTEAHRQAMFAAAEAHEDLGLDTLRRIDVFSSLDTRGLKLIFRPLDCAALYMPAIDGGHAGAIINSGHPLALQRYSAAHEFGHHVFGHGPQIEFEAEIRVGRDDLSPHEKLAEAFAAWFVLPPETADVALEQIGISKPRDPADVYALALRAGTSYAATCVHLPSLKLAARSSATAWASIAPRTVKIALTPSPPPGGWRNDVWVLTELDGKTTLFPRAGDRLLLPPFDGSSWSPCELPAGSVLVEAEPSDLFSAVVPTRTLIVDLPLDMPAGPACLVAKTGTQIATFALDVQRPRNGLFLQARPTSEARL